jgi:hypothetical protein
VRRFSSPAGADDDALDRFGPASFDPPVPDWPKPFREAFCEHYGCALEAYADEVFRRGLHRHAVPVAWLIRALKPSYFDEDFEFIEEVGEVTNSELFKNEINYFHGRNLRHRSWIRRLFRIRLSGQRVVRIRRRLFP